MNIRKTLRTTLGSLALGTVLALTGCNQPDHPEYHFNGSLCEETEEGTKCEHVHFYEDKPYQDYQVLEVTREDGTIVKYSDDGDDDYRLDYVTIQVKGKKTTYNKSSKVGKPVVEVAQKQYGDYLKRIFEHKKQKGLDLINK